MTRIESTTSRVTPRPRVPPGDSGHRRPWLRVAVCGSVLVLAGLLLFEAYVSSSFAPDVQAGVGDQDAVPAVISSGGPIIDATGAEPRSFRLPPKTIALTFDDGPDPVWTPRVLDVLRRHGVPATFFVIGSEVVRHPRLARRIVADGNEVGAHTFTHPDIARLPTWRRSIEYRQTTAAIAYATSTRPTLLRFPYSSEPDAIDNDLYSAVREVGRLGNLTVVNDTDSQDWARPGVNAILANAAPRDNRGAVVLMHDAGGDRSQTVAALDRFIPMMQSRGYTFTTVTGGLNRALGSTTRALTGNPAAGRYERVSGLALFWAVRIADAFVGVLRLLFAFLGALVVARTLLLLVLAHRLARRRRAPDWTWGPPVTEPVSVVVPAYNEREGIAATLRSLAANDHPLEIIVVDDGSTDGTADIADGLGLPNVRVVRKANGGKASALNAGIALARYELLVMVDADTVFEPDSIRRLVQPFADDRTGAVAGNVKVGNRASLLGLWQHIEYVIGFNLDRRLYDTLGCMPTVPGAIGAFRRRAVLAAGGMTADTLAEDTDITMALLRDGWRVVYEPTARAWTEAPATLTELWRQRYRWSYGTMQAMWKHRRAWRDSGASGRFGRVGLPFLALFGVLLPMLAPILDLMAVYSVLLLDSVGTAVIWLLMLGMQVGTAFVAFRLDREDRRALWAVPLQQFVYRQLMYLVLIRAVVSAMTGTHVRWRKLQRRGLAPVTGARPARPAGPVLSGRPAPAAGPVLPARPAPAAGRALPAGPGPAARPAVRDRWFDTLRALALLRVFVYHMFGFGWLSLAFPAMGIMFALAGSLMAGSLDRSPRHAVAGRIRRLLPALWALGALLVPLMLWRGWPDRPAWPALLTWVVPVFQPPGSEWAQPATEVLWYLVTYFWLVLLSPALLWLYRRRPLATVLLPIVVLAGIVLVPGLVNPDGGAGAVVTDLATFTACWVVGFAHREGALRRLSVRPLMGGALVAMGVGLGWALTHRGDNGIDLNDIPLAQACWSLGFVLLLLRATPSLGWLARARPLAGLVDALNRRAVTIYLWHNMAVGVSFAVGDALGLWRLGETGYVLVALALLMVPLLGLGWLEDVAARRLARLLPTQPRRRSAAGAAQPLGPGQRAADRAGLEAGTRSG
ncbi:glycosyltransferase [Plantactinospora siamensis]|uniref:Glycosyltransferase n=1 Tax=Plantactinospora siamensis TaxID=555372 RepID=A0ABV6P1A0_9ACTN